MMNPNTTVLILNWNGAALLREFLPEVIAATDPATGCVTVADNGSTDDSLKVLREEFPEVGVIALPENYGFAEGYNRAIAQVTTPYVVLLNSDVAPAPGWLAPMVRLMEENPRIAAVQPKIRSRREPEKFEHAGAAGGLIDRNGFPYCLGRVFEKVEDDRGQYDGSPRRIFWASGAAMLTRTALYRELGGLDPSFFAHMEEIDFCWRAQLAGYEIFAQPESTVFHVGGASLPYSNPRKTYLNFRNNLLMMHKNLPPEIRRGALVRRRLIDTLAFLKFAATLDLKNARAVVKAHRDYRRMARSIPPTPAANRNLLEGRPNILVDHYLKRKL